MRSVNLDPPTLLSNWSCALQVNPEPFWPDSETRKLQPAWNWNLYPTWQYTWCHKNLSENLNLFGRKNY